IKHFINRQAQDIAVHGGDAVQLPVQGVFLDNDVGLVAVLQSASNERVGEGAHCGFLSAGGRQLERLAPMGGALLVGDGGGALVLPKLVQRRIEVLRRIQLMLKEELYGALPRLASFAHNSNHAVENMAAK